MSLVKLLSKADHQRCLSVDNHDRVVMSLDDPFDPKQRWEKIDLPSGDRPAYCEFGLRNDFNQKVLTHQHVEDEGELTIVASSAVNFTTNRLSVAGSINTIMNPLFSVEARSDIRVRNERGDETVWETSYTTRVTSPRARDGEERGRVTSPRAPYGEERGRATSPRARDGQERGRVTMSPYNGRFSNDTLFIMPVGGERTYHWIRPAKSKTFYLDANIGGEARAEVDLSRQNRNSNDSQRWKIMHVLL